MGIEYQDTYFEGACFAHIQLHRNDSYIVAMKKFQKRRAVIFHHIANVLRI
jgi:hypothetical protein